MNTLSNVSSQRDKDESPCIRFASDALPKVQMPIWAENSQTGVSTENALPEAKPNIIKRRKQDIAHWYALRTTYGREKKAYEYFIEKGTIAFYPTLTKVKLIDGKKKAIEVSRLPNIFFAYGTEEEIKSFVYNNVNLPYLRFYYRHFHVGNNIVKEPLIIPDFQMESFKIICTSDAKDIIFIPNNIPKFRTGQLVRIVEGDFKGVIGKVARYHGQQRVAVIIDGLLTIATAYIPNAFLHPLEAEPHSSDMI